MSFETGINTSNYLIARLKIGDKSALSLLYDKYWAGLIRTCGKVVEDSEVSEDIVQEVFLLIWEKREILDIKKDIESFLYGVLRFKIFNYLKTTRRRSMAYSRMALIYKNLSYSSQTPEDLLEQKELYDSVSQLVLSLPDRCRVVYQMRQEGMSYQDIANTLRISPKTVENQLYKARKFLRTSLRQVFQFFMSIGLIIGV